MRISAKINSSMERKSSTLWSAIIFLTSYGLWCFFFRIVFKTLITYFSRSADSALHDIADSFASSGLIVAALSSASFLWFTLQMSSLQGGAQKWSQLFQWHEFKTQLPQVIRGGLQGGLLALGLIAVLIVNGDYVYLGGFVQMNEPVYGIAALAIRTLALLCMVACEEVLFARIALSPTLKDSHWLMQAFIGGISYAGIKAIQFDIGVMQGLTLFLLGAIGFLMLQSQPSRHFGFLTGLLGMFHLCMGQPIFGSNFNGLFLFRVTESESVFKVFFTGGLGGPLSSFALQVLLLVLFLSRVFKHAANTQNQTRTGQTVSR